jgi:DNA-binding transcriptional LysR family regulator
VELRQLRHFLALAEERSITRAAKRELIVQSGLSNSLQALERELGTPLYVRGTRPVRLTAAGEALVGPTRRTLASAAEAEQAVHGTRDVLIGTLRMGVSLSAQHLVPFASVAHTPGDPQLRARAAGGLKSGGFPCPCRWAGIP